MVTFEQALNIILTDVKRMPAEHVDFEDALYRILAKDVLSDVDMPPFNKAAMDGFACRQADLHRELEVLETIAAGQTARYTVGSGQCTRIMTGAEVPDGADTVIMVEQTEEVGNERIRFTGEKTAQNIAMQAEEVKKGDVVLKSGKLIMPQDIAILASVGHVKPLVSRQPRVAILSTGNELVEPDQVPGTGMIRNSNGYQLTAQVKNARCIANYMGIVADDKAATDSAISKALAENDVVVLSGGVSMGDFDFVPEIMKKNKVEIGFQKVAVKPGRPTVFGKTAKTAIFGLPGYPVSSFINFEVFVKPLLFSMMGCEYKPLQIKLPMGVHFKRKKADRREFLPVCLNNNGEVVPVHYQGSAHIHAVTMAQALMNIPAGVFEIEKGALADVRPI